MNIARLFNVEMTVSRTSSVTRDSIGGIASEEFGTTTVFGWLEPVASAEDHEQRETQMGRWVAYLPPLTDVTGWDRLQALGHDFDVDGPSRLWVHPVTTDPIYREVSLREVL
jgi:hypothetical protein